MTLTQLAELAIAALLAATAIWLYRRPAAAVDARHGSQGAVLLLAIAVILAIHGAGLLDYRPAGAHL